MGWTDDIGDLFDDAGDTARRLGHGVEDAIERVDRVAEVTWEHAHPVASALDYAAEHDPGTMALGGALVPGVVMLDMAAHIAADEIQTIASDTALGEYGEL